MRASGAGTQSGSPPGTGDSAAASGPAVFLYGIDIPAGAPFATKINQQNGTLTASPTGPFVDVESGTRMGIDASGHFLYEAAQNGLWAFSINRQDGSLSTIQGSPYAGTESLAGLVVDRAANFVYATDQKANTILAFSMNSSGQLTPVAGSPFTTGAAPNWLAIDSTGRFLYAATTAGVFGYSVGGSGALSAIAGSPFAGATMPRGMGVDPTNKFLYETDGANAPNGVTFGYSIDANTGALTPIPGSPFHPAGSDMAFAPNGKFAFIDGAGTFSIDQTSGALAQVSNFIPGRFPVVDPTGKFLWAVTFDTSCWHCNLGPSTYQLDQNTGTLTLVPNSLFVMTNDNVGDVNQLAVTQ